MAVPTGGGRRIEALDMLRGLAVAGMIVVVSPGAWDKTYAPLQHAEWHGWTAGDLVFPTFLFAVGFALGLSFPRTLDRPHQRGAVWARILRRVASLIALGLLLNALPHFDLAGLRIPGILQRIALCYLLGAALCLLSARRGANGLAALDVRAIAVAIVAILLLYWAALTFVPVPGFGAGRLDPAGNLPGAIDRAVFTVPHLWSLGRDETGQVTYDPEGLLSTLPATVNVLFGVLAAWWWKRAPDRAVPVVIAAGAALILLGLLLDPVFPINKRIWTSSFALLSSGWAAVALGVLALAVRASAVAVALTPLKVLGGNAIVAFVLSQLLGVASGLPLIAGQTLQSWGFATAQRIVPDPYLASLLCAVAVLVLITLAIAPFHRRGLHLRL